MFFNARRAYNFFPAESGRKKEFVRVSLWLKNKKREHKNEKLSKRIIL